MLSEVELDLDYDRTRNEGVKINIKKSNNCIHSTDNSKCCKKSLICYGGYCKKHKDEFLLKEQTLEIEGAKFKVVSTDLSNNNVTLNQEPSVVEYFDHLSKCIHDRFIYLS